MNHSREPLTSAEQMQRIREVVLNTDVSAPKEAYAILASYFSRMDTLRKHVEELESKMLLKEPPAGSGAPLIGPLLAKSRVLWYRTLLKWYTLPLVIQQNQYNATIAQTLRDLVMTTESIAGLLKELEIRITKLEKGQAQ